VVESDADSRPGHQFIAEKADEVWQQAKPFICDAFVLSAVVQWWEKPSRSVFRDCLSQKIQKSGLWNVDHVDESYGPAYLCI